MIRRSFMSAAALISGTLGLLGPQVLTAKPSTHLLGEEAIDIQLLKLKIKDTLGDMPNSRSLANNLCQVKEIVTRREIENGYFLKFKNYSGDYVSVVRRDEECQYFFHNEDDFDVHSIGNS